MYRKSESFVVGVLAFGILLLSYTLPASSAILFSVDAGSPAIDGNLTPDDVLRPGPVVALHGSALGLRDDFFLGDFDVLDALSQGRESVTAPLLFSVDRVAVGLPGTAVHAQAQPGAEEAAGDVFRAFPPAGTNLLQRDEQALGLKPGLFGDDLDSLATVGGPGTYFSIDALSASNGFGAGDLANDIFLDDLMNLYAEGMTHIGLDPLDDLDALILDDRFQPGVLNPGRDRALFSLTTFSPNTFTSGLGLFSPSDVLFTDFTGRFSRFAAASELGLRDDDELDALDTIPEPGSSWIFAVMLCWLALASHTVRRRTGGARARSRDQPSR